MNTRQELFISMVETAGRSQLEKQAKEGYAFVDLWASFNGISLTSEEMEQISAAVKEYAAIFESLGTD